MRNVVDEHQESSIIYICTFMFIAQPKHKKNDKLI